MVVKKNNLFIPLAFEMLGFIIRIMMCYKPKEQYLEEARSAIKFALQCLNAISVLPVKKKETYEKPFEKISNKHIPDA